MRKDIDGFDRPRDGRIDIGADEVDQGTAWAAPLPLPMRSITVVKNSGNLGDYITGPGILCGMTCTSQVLEGSRVVLQIYPIQENGQSIHPFTWTSGPCAGTSDEDCAFIASSSITAAATFDSCTINCGGVPPPQNPAPLRVVQWTPPVGIPEPAFGIREDVTHYALRSGTCSDPDNSNKCFNYGNGLEPYRLNALGEPYTHYVNSEIRACSTTVTTECSTNVGNPFGSPDKPRRGIPYDPPPGSIVEMHGLNLDGQELPAGITGDKNYIFGRGTAQRPIFFRGATTTDRARFTGDYYVFGEYLILENFEMYRGQNY